MDLFEYQARDLFAAHGVPVLDGIVAGTPEAAREAAQKIGGEIVVVKAQVKTSQSLTMTWATSSRTSSGKFPACAISSALAASMPSSASTGIRASASPLARPSRP